MVDCSGGSEIEKLVKNTILEHLETAAVWRSRYLDEQYAVFDQLALKYEDAARRLEVEWARISSGLAGIN